MAENGTVAYVGEFPECDVCKHVGTQSERESPAIALYDLKTKDGPWAYVCSPHRGTHAMHSSLGVGKGQMLVLRLDPVTEGEAG